MMNIIAVTCLVLMTLSFFGVVYVLYLLYKLEKGTIKEAPEATEITYWSRKLCGNCASDCDKKTREINNADGECLCYVDSKYVEAANKTMGF